jgi:hypothetical protein
MLNTEFKKFNDVSEPNQSADERNIVPNSNQYKNAEGRVSLQQIPDSCRNEIFPYCLLIESVYLV